MDRDGDDVSRFEPGGHDAGRGAAVVPVVVQLHRDGGGLGGTGEAGVHETGSERRADVVQWALYSKCVSLTSRLGVLGELSGLHERNFPAD